MARLKQGQDFNPLEVLQWIFPEAWEYFIPDVLIEIERLHLEGKIVVKQNGLSPNFPLKSVEEIIISIKV
ncbi:hypothetical protein [Belliella aquatica]|uniref:Uncharacterized protein n=1 Tax=Belliella aquatica TaxID=1323734 RepID=A0ABQ1MFD1_9BACT|nr:hypothetical protein [Belliella aquatica]MCH7405214.1 hypothetical protein [Belliella aquatica]GGC38818.1 hypothetical protein GCM10010993_17010 [Belliella aquatica]